MEKMNIEEFADYIKDHILEHMSLSSEDYNVRMAEITKNNGLVLHGLSICESEMNIAPTIYVEKEHAQYMLGKPIEDCMSSIAKVYEENKVPKNITIDFFTDFNQAKEKLAMKIVNFDQNREMLKDAPHYIYGDLAAIFQVQVNADEMGTATITVQNRHMELWGVTPAILLEETQNNMTEKQPFHIQNLADVLREMMTGVSPEAAEQFVEDMDPMMYVMSNETKINGAAAIIFTDKIHEFAEQHNANLYILPSSIHELLLLPDNGNLDVRHLTEMVCEVNATQVEPEEVLSNHVYFYDKELKQLQLAETKEPMTLREGNKDVAAKVAKKEETKEQKPIKDRLNDGKEKAQQQTDEPRETKSQLRRLERQ